MIVEEEFVEYEENLLESLRRKEEFLKNHSKQYEPMTQRERDILMSGWAACETMTGIENLEKESICPVK